MQITVNQVDAATKRVTLKGRLDLAAVEAIGVPLMAVTAARGNVIVDMAGVDFITSVGIRHLVLAAQKVAQGGAGSCCFGRPRTLRTSLWSPAWSRFC